ncbi:MAG: hypothetical protein M3Y21_09550 [Candidatus Eremiobacteraeota bacterium]|nr:hypothetical protein [Candidatus Eremiobacteraeota bacterium]
MIGSIVFAAALITTPSPTPEPLKEIGHVRSSAVCSHLRNIVAPVVYGFSANDRILFGWRLDMGKFRGDVQSGSSGRKELDLVRMDNLTHKLVENINIIENVLVHTKDDYHSKNSKETATLAALDARMRDVLARQKFALDQVSGFVETTRFQNLAAAGGQYQGAINEKTKTDTASRFAGTPLGEATPAPVANQSISQNGINDPTNPDNFNPATFQIDPLGAAVSDVDTMLRWVDLGEKDLGHEITAAVPTCRSTP